MKNINLEYLRRYREEVLQGNGLGRILIRLYNWFSSWMAPIANRFAPLRWLIWLLFYLPAAAWARMRVNRKSYRAYRGGGKMKRATRKAEALVQNGKNRV
ncbi:MAG TPA: hypothetical protein ENJ82_15205 [Bacteroidetes bacterium]|nr:hypothetical protein [Bacteroidota bacterium]